VVEGEDSDNQVGSPKKGNEADGNENMIE